MLSHFLFRSQVQLKLEGGIGLSLVNKAPEELIFASFTGINVHFTQLSSSQVLELSIQDVQVKEGADSPLPRECQPQRKQWGGGVERCGFGVDSTVSSWNQPLGPTVRNTAFETYLWRENCFLEAREALPVRRAVFCPLGVCNGSSLPFR